MKKQDRINKLCSYSFQIDGEIVPKARPRVTRGKAYLPQRYRNWKNQAISQLLSQRTIVDPLKKVIIKIELYGKLRGDLDNLSGAILDALVQAQIIVDDRISVLKELSVKHCDGKTKQARINITEIV